MIRKLILPAALAAVLAAPARALLLTASDTLSDGTGSIEQASDVARGMADDVYVTGFVNQGGNQDLWVARYSKDLVLLSSVTMDGAGGGADEGRIVTMGDSNHVYVLGLCHNGANFDPCLFRFTTGLALLSSTTVNMNGAATADTADGLALGAGGVFAAGTRGTAAWLVQHDMELVMSASTTFSPGARQTVGGLVRTPNTGHIFMAGATSPSAQLQDHDGYVAQYFPNTLDLGLWRSVIASPNSFDQVNALGFSADETVYVAGTTVVSGEDTLWLAEIRADLSTESLRKFPGIHDGQDLVVAGGSIYVSGRASLAGAELPAFAAPRAAFTPDEEELWVGRFDMSLGILEQVLQDGTHPGGNQDAAYGIDAWDGDIFVSGRLRDTSTGVDGWIGRYSPGFQTLGGAVATGRGYPNPFQPGQGSMTFDQVPAGTRMRIYTQTGVLVRELRSGAAGTASWDGRNESGETVASGVYVALLEAPDGATKKVKVVVQK